MKRLTEKGPSQDDGQGLMLTAGLQARVTIPPLVGQMPLVGLLGLWGLCNTVQHCAAQCSPEGRCVMGMGWGVVRVYWGGVCVGVGDVGAVLGLCWGNI